MTTLRIYVFLLGTLALGEMANAGTKTKCDVVFASFLKMYAGLTKLPSKRRALISN